MARRSSGKRRTDPDLAKATRGSRRVPADVGEDVAPALVGADVPDEEDRTGEGLVELERLDLEPDPGQDGIGHGPDPGVVGPGREREGQRQGQKKAADPEYEQGLGQAARADARRPHRDDLRVGRKTRQPADDAHQDGHRQGEDEDGRDEQHEKSESREPGHALVDEQVGQEQDLIHQQDEGDEQQSEEERRDDLAEDVPVEKARHRPQDIAKKRWGQTYTF